MWQPRDTFIYGHRYDDILTLKYRFWRKRLTTNEKETDTDVVWSSVHRFPLKEDFSLKEVFVMRMTQQKQGATDQ